jgi:hypothetical protein
MTQTIGAIGLLLNIIGSLLLLRYPPGTYTVTADGRATLIFTGREKLASRIAILTLTGGFVVQLIALLSS